MSPTTPYIPEPGSPVARVLDLLARNPEDDYTSGDLALKFQVKSTAWPPTLAKAKALGLVSYAATVEDEPKAWSAGPNLATWMAQRNGAASAPPPLQLQARRCAANAVVPGQACPRWTWPR